MPALPSANVVSARPDDGAVAAVGVGVLGDVFGAGAVVAVGACTGGAEVGLTASGGLGGSVGVGVAGAGKNAEHATKFNAINANVRYLRIRILVFSFCASCYMSYAIARSTRATTRFK
jgi:hypothetical protein